MTDALETFRRQMGAMSGGDFRATDSKTMSNIFAGDMRGSVAQVHQYSVDGSGPPERERRANAAGIVTAVRLAQYLAGDEAREALARVIEPRGFLKRPDGSWMFPLLRENALAKADEWLARLAQIATQPPSAQEDAG